MSTIASDNGIAAAPAVTTADGQSREHRVLERRIRLETRRLQKATDGKQKGGVKTQRVTANPGESAGTGTPDVNSASFLAAESKSKIQVETSKKVLESVKNNAHRMVTNVLVAVQSRESARRAEESAKLASIRGKKEAEKAKGVALGATIERYWELPASSTSSASSKNNPYTLKQLLDQQQASCKQLMDMKQRLIVDFQNEFKLKDDDYVKEVKRQSAEIDTLLERMTKLRQEVRVAVAQELDQIEQAFMQERNDLLGKFLGETEQLMSSRRANEGKYLESNLERVDDHIKGLRDLRTQDTEDYNLTKIKLETDVQVLEQQLQQMRATYQLNSEKLEYNFQVLKKRDEENSVTIITQKRKINRLNDIANALRGKLQKQEDAYHKEFHQLSDDYKRIMEQFAELQRKFRRFQTLDNKKFQDLWEMNEEEALEQLRKVVAADRVLWEQQLGSKWKCPSALQKLLDWGHSNGVTEESTGNNNATEGRSHEDGNERLGLASAMTSSFTQQELLQLLNKESTKQVLDLLTAESSAFLVEEKLHKLLAPLHREEQNLMKLDSIFKALAIQTVKDVERLQSYFLAEVDAGKSVDADNSANADKTLVELIHPNEVVRAIRKFVAESRGGAKGADAARRELLRQQQQNMEKTEEQKLAFWTALQDAIDMKNFHVWDFAYTSMQNYNKLLNARLKAKRDVEELESQNAELKELLDRHMHSKVNDELVVPPSQTLYQQE